MAPRRNRAVCIREDAFMTMYPNTGCPFSGSSCPGSLTYPLLLACLEAVSRQICLRYASKGVVSLRPGLRAACASFANSDVSPVTPVRRSHELSLCPPRRPLTHALAIKQHTRIIHNCSNIPAHLACQADRTNTDSSTSIILQLRPRARTALYFPIGPLFLPSPQSRSIDS